MLRKNQIIPLEITGLTHEGNGVGRYEGMAVFVPLCAPGDIISARIVKVLSNRAFGIIQQLEKPSASRMENDCPVFSRCGGCTLRHISYDSELAAKREWVKQNMSRIGGFDIEPEPVAASPISGRYRNKAQYPVRLVDGRLRTGFFAARSHRLIPVEDCLLQPEFFAGICKTVTAFMEEYKIPAYDEDSHEGLVRHIYLRYAEVTGQTLVCIVINAARLPNVEILANRIASACPGDMSMCVNVNTARTNVIMGPITHVITGTGHIEDIICGVRIRLSPQSFYQVNRGAAELLYRSALELASPGPRDILLDLYCGAGAIGLSMAGSTGKIIGVEAVGQAVTDAVENAGANGVTNAEFLHADAERAAAKLLERGISPAVVVTDPPRKGMEPETVGHIASMNPGRIVYISCDSATLARDCKLFAEYGYMPRQIKPVDLFPRTSHVECAALLSRS